jgi:hypothetical protein
MFTGGLAWGIVEIQRDKRLIDTLAREGMPDRRVARAMITLRRPFRYLVPELMQLSLYWLVWHSIWPLPIAPVDVRENLADGRLAVDLFTPGAAVILVLLHYWGLRRSRKIIEEKLT